MSEFLDVIADGIEKTTKVLAILNEHKEVLDSNIKELNEKLKQYDVKIEVNMVSTKSRFMQKLDKMMAEAKLKKNKL